MRITVSQPALLKSMQVVSGLVEKRQTVSILSHVLLTAFEDRVEFSSTDNEMAIMYCCLDAQVSITGSVAVSARKLLEIAKVFNSTASIQIFFSDSKLLVESEKTRFSLATLPVADFPQFQSSAQLVKFSLPFAQLMSHLSATAFAIGDKDVRLYFNGLLLSIESNRLTTVASDSHRLAVMTTDIDVSNFEQNLNSSVLIQVVLLKKMVIELLRMNWVLGQVSIAIGTSDMQISNQDFCFSSRLLDAQYPDYRRVLPVGESRTFQVDKAIFRDALMRASILAPDNKRFVCCYLSPGLLRLHTNNVDQESLVNELIADYVGDPLEMVYNVDFCLDIIQVFLGDFIQFEIFLPSLAAILTDVDSAKSQYLIMPMLL